MSTKSETDIKADKLPTIPALAAAPAITKSFRLDDYSMHTLRANLKELTQVAILKLIPPFSAYIMGMFASCREAVLDGTAPYEGPVADLRLLQDKLREIRELNAQQIVAETAKIVAGIAEKDWPLSDIIATILYVKSMILASIRAPDMKERVYVPIPSVETFVHTCLCILARKVFDFPSMVKRYADDDEQTVHNHRMLLQKSVKDSILNAITDLTPTAEIVNKYVKQVLQNVKQETDARVIKDSDKYGFEDAEELDEESEYSDSELSEDDVYVDDDRRGSSRDYVSGSESETESESEEEEEKHQPPPPVQKRHHHHENREEKKVPKPDVAAKDSIIIDLPVPVPEVKIPTASTKSEIARPETDAESPKAEKHRSSSSHSSHSHKEREHGSSHSSKKKHSDRKK